RVSAMAIAQNVGTMLSALTPALFALLAPPGSNVPLIVGSITFGITIIAAIAAFSARETYRLRLEDLGDANATPIELAEYTRLQAANTSRKR
ncbi:MAG: MFS transporter, partial [Acidobacteria bacterium]|nr:MFS transporter [Acidobacteriota bacterium]